MHMSTTLGWHVRLTERSGRRILGQMLWSALLEIEIEIEIEIESRLVHAGSSYIQG